MRAAACALLSVLAACSGPASQSPRDAGAGPLRVDTGLASASGAEPVLGVDALAASPTGLRHKLRVGALTGRVLRDEAPIAAGAELRDDALLQLERGARATLFLDDYVRVELQGPSTARMLPRGQPALLLREGALTVDVAPRGVHGTHSAFWLATPLARVDVADSARLVLRVSRQGAGELAVVSGHAQLARSDAAQLLPAGSAHCVGPSGLGPLSRGFRTLEQAAQAFATGPSCAGRTGADSALSERSLESALDAVHKREQSELSLLAEHARLVSLGDARAQAIRGVLAGSAATLARQRAWASAQHAQLQAWLLGRTPTARQLALSERARMLVPYSD